jgi:hypothetical protein
MKEINVGRNQQKSLCLCRPRKKGSRVWGIIVEAGVFVAAKVAKTKTK